MIRLQIDDSRRLTGKNLLSEHPGAILDAFVGGVDRQKVIDCWKNHVQELLNAVGWGEQQTFSRKYQGGISVMVTAPMDGLYAATERNETAWRQVQLALGVEPDMPPLSVAELLEKINEEANPALLELIARAKDHGVPWLADDDEFSLGYGDSVHIWPVSALPDPATLDWSNFRAIPIALITGTNGKSTSVRLASEVVAGAGFAAGVTSTDFIRVGKTILDQGDYSGPGGARMLLRNEKTQMALLEVARGGLLRRGLPVKKVDAALVTNVAEDHLGQYGIYTVDELVQAKLIVAKGLTDGVLVVNADDPVLVNGVKKLTHTLCWFSLDEQNARIQEQLRSGGRACFVVDDQFVFSDHGRREVIATVNDVPMTFAGAARHNVHNALGVIGLAKALGIDNEAIRKGLMNFKSDAEDNPGRGNQFLVKDARVFVDFAHNEHSMTAMAVMVDAMSAVNQRWLMLSHAGDRSDEEIDHLTRAALKMKPDRIVVAEVEKYLRGRQPGEVPGLIAKSARKYGLSEDAVVYADSPLEGVKIIKSELQPGDLALLFVLADRDDVNKELLG